MPARKKPVTRSAFLTFRLTPAELTKLRKDAKGAGKKLRTFVREKLEIVG